ISMVEEEIRVPINSDEDIVAARQKGRAVATDVGFSSEDATLIATALANEIQRVAHAVHDEAGQRLVAARLAMQEVTDELSPSLQGRLQVVGAILDQAEEHLRVPAVQFLA